jgi:hypothetical protein
MVSSVKVICRMKKNSWLTFIAGAAVGAGITWLLSSKEGKQIIEQLSDKGNDLKNKAEEELAGLNKQINDWVEGKNNA